jgi:hypothetical protein
VDDGPFSCQRDPTSVYCFTATLCTMAFSSSYSICESIAWFTGLFLNYCVGPALFRPVDQFLQNVVAVASPVVVVLLDIVATLSRLATCVVVPTATGP